MKRKDMSIICNQQLGVCSSEPDDTNDNKRPKPIEIYTFIDPLCADCWAFEPILKKLQIEYGDYFRIRTLIVGRLQTWNKCNYPTEQNDVHKNKIAAQWKKVASYSGMSCNEEVWSEHDLTTPYLTSLAIKAAELQGPQAGVKFLRKLRELLFLEKQDITREDVILNCAKLSGIDFLEFKNDLLSESAERALQCDINISNEMDVDTAPTFVFFNNNIEDEGIKISGHYPYYIYIQVLEEMLGYKPERAEPISLEQFLKRYGFVATIEVAISFDLTKKEAKRQLKKLALQQKVEAVPVKYGTFWRYLN